MKTPGNMKMSTILKMMKMDFKTLCKKINVYDILNYHIRNGEEAAFSGRNGQQRYASFLLRLADSDLKLPTVLLDYLITNRVHNQTYKHLSCDYSIRVALAKRKDLKKRHIDFLSECIFGNDVYILRQLALNPIVDEKTLRENLFLWLEIDGCGVFGGSAASIAINRINFSVEEINNIYYNYKDFTKKELVDIVVLLANYKNTPKELFSEFCKYENCDDFYVKVTLAGDVRTPIEYLEKLTSDNHRWTSEGSKKTLEKIKLESEL